MIAETVTVGAGTAYPLSGILTLPEDTGHSLPAVVLVHGSGPSNMDEKIGGLTPFKDIAEGLTDRGIAVLRYDKRTFAHGRKCLREKDVTVRFETIEDALLAADLLRRHPRVDPDRVFLLGHSMGAMLAPRIDAEGGNFRGLILMAGSPRRLEEIMLDQNRALAEQLSRPLRPLIRGQIKKLEKLFSGLDTLSDQQAKSKKIGNGITLHYFKEMADHPTSAYLEKLEKPILILQGDMDFQATEAQDYRAYRELLAGRPNVTFRLYQGLNHAFVTAQSASLLKANREYRRPRHIGEAVLTDIADFILENSK